MAPAMQDKEIFLAQRLASNETSTRTKALKTLRKYISLRSQKDGFTNTDLLKIWKGLFYCLWMQDKPLLQEELSDQISKLMHSFSTTDSQLLYFETFLQTIKREWNGIDRLRMDKFFQLVRFVFRQAFDMLKRTEWEASVVNNFLKVFAEELLQSSESIPNGLVLHVLDVYMTELAQIGSAELTADQNLSFIDPFCKTMAKSKDRRLVNELSKSIFSTIVEQAALAVGDLIAELRRGGEEDSDSGQTSEDDETVEQLLKGAPEAEESDQNGEEELPDMEVAHPDETSNDDTEPVLQFDYGVVADRLFELGSQKSTPDYNRTRVYSMVKIFRDLSEGVFPQNDDADELERSKNERNKRKNKKNRKLGKRAEDSRVAKKHKAACKIGEKPREADQTNASSPSETEREGSQDNEDKVQDDKPGLQRQVKSNIKNKRRKGKKLKLDMLEDGEEAAPDACLISKAVDKNVNGGDEGVKRQPVQKTVTEEQTTVLSSNGRKSGEKHKPNQTGKPISQCVNNILENIYHSEDCSDPAPLKKKKKKKCTTADKGGTTGGTAGQTGEGATAAEKSCQEKSPEKPTETSHQTDRAACNLVKKTNRKRKMVMEKRTDAEIHTLPEKTSTDIQAEANFSSVPAEVNVAEQHSSNTTAPLMKKKNKNQKSKGKTTKPKSSGDVAVTSDCTDTKTDYVGAEKAGVVEDPKLTTTKKEKIKPVSPEEQELRVEEEPSVGAAPRTPQTDVVNCSSCTPTPRKKMKLQKRKTPLSERLAGELDVDVQPPENTPMPTKHKRVELSSSVKKKPKASQEASLISFQGDTTPPTPLFCKIKPKGPSTPLSSTKAFHTPQSEPKKVTFGLKNNKTTEFRKTDWSLLVSPVGSSRVAFDPKKRPLSGVLKSPAMSPTVSVKKTVSKRRPTAADFF